MRIVGADVGGTKSLVALYEGEPGAFALVRKARYESAAYPGITPIIADFLGNEPIHAAALAVAGPVIDDTCRATNLPWHIDARAIERDLAIDRVKLVNDFEAVALGIGELTNAELAVLQDRPLEVDAPIAILGAGTGLGEAIALPPGAPGALPRVLPTEGGHCDLAPRDRTEIALLEFMMERYPDHVSYERVVSGPGIAALYDFVVARGLAPESEAVRARLAPASDRAALIGQLAPDDAACGRAIALFVSILGAEAGNLALKTLPRGGLYVAGGIAPKLIDAIASGAFMAAFRAKGRMEPVLDQIRVSVVMNDQVGLLGARRLAVSMVR